MASTPGTGLTPSAASLLERLRSDKPAICVELRPPRLDMEAAASMDTWMEMNAALRRLTRRDTVVFLTDQAVGTREEENLQHLMTNLEEDVPRDRICPFLTTKHSEEYCEWYAVRAMEAGYPGLVVLGGDKEVGPPRCVPHAYALRQRIRARHPGLLLGGWANPHRDPGEQVSYLQDANFTGEFFLTQIVSHHDLSAVDAFLAEKEKRGIDLPGMFGVFFYRSGNRKTLGRLSQFIQVPVAPLRNEFRKEGLSAEAICARSIRALRERGIRHVYLSNLPLENAADRLEVIEAILGG